MFNANGTNIMISREDTGIITITMTGDVPIDGTTALVTLRKKIGDEKAIWEKELTVSEGQIVIELASEDTDIPFGDYCWDVRLIYANGEVFTPFEPALFRIVEVVGDV